MPRWWMGHRSSCGAVSVGWALQAGKGPLTQETQRNTGQSCGVTPKGPRGHESRGLGPGMDGGETY